MRVFAVWTSLATIVTLNVVIVLGLLGASDTLLYGLIDRQWTGVATFAVIVAGLLVVVALRVTGQHLSLGLHLVTDLGALNGYLIATPCYRSNLTRRTT